MVTFQSIRSSLANNMHSAMCVEAFRIRPQPIVESFKLPTVRIDPVKIPMLAAAAAAAVPKLRDVETKRAVSPARSEESIALPPPNRVIGASVPKLPTPPTSPSPDSNKSVTVATTTAVTPRAVSTAPISKRVLDPICIGLESVDAMYAIATHNVQQSLECEEARRLEGLIGSLYKEESGRSRGWTKTKLDAFFIPRAAQGSRVREAFDWSKIWTDKDASALLDFVSLAKGIRIAVCREDGCVGLWPAADSSKQRGAIPVYHVNSTGRMLEKPENALKSCKLLAPYSVEHGLEKLSLDELDGLAEKMGIPIPSGKKAEKVRMIASARMAMRIQ